MILKQYINEMAENPVKSDAIVSDKAILRQAIIAEYDAVNLYEQFANSTSNKDLKNVMLHVAQEEKVHIGEFEYLLKKLDKEFANDIKDGYKEAQEEIK